MGKFIDLTGQRFGRLTVVRKNAKDSNGKINWLCRCDCGNQKIISGNSLRSGATKSCGCIVQEVKNNLTGKRFGEWTVESYAGNKMWNCVCSCGTRRVVWGADLVRRGSLSCGCKQKLNLQGEKFGLLTVLYPEGTSNDRSILWRCKCDCGKEVSVKSSSLTCGNTQSCGCTRSTSLIKHGKIDVRLYRVWSGMKSRCYNPNSKPYKNYGGRGIAVCDEWKDDFQAFYDWAYANGYDENAPFGECTIDRIDNNKGYSPENCRWVDMAAQNQNKRAKNGYKIIP